MSTVNLGRCIFETLKEVLLNFAVPKKKVTLAKRRIRAKSLAIENKMNLYACPTCGSPKRKHNLCRTCLNRVNKKTFY